MTVLLNGSWRDARAAVGPAPDSTRGRRPAPDVHTGTEGSPLAVDGRVTRLSRRVGGSRGVPRAAPRARRTEAGGRAGRVSPPGARRAAPAVPESGECGPDRDGPGQHHDHRARWRRGRGRRAALAAGGVDAMDRLGGQRLPGFEHTRRVLSMPRTRAWGMSPPSTAAATIATGPICRRRRRPMVLRLRGVHKHRLRGPRAPVLPAAACGSTRRPGSTMPVVDPNPHRCRHVPASPDQGGHCGGHGHAEKGCYLRHGAISKGLVSDDPSVGLSGLLRPGAKVP